MIFQTLRTILRLERNRLLNRARFEAERTQRFRKFAHWVAERSPYYADVVRRHRIDLGSCQPEDFPDLTKAEVIEHFDRIVTDRTLCRADLQQFLSRSTDPRELYRGRYRIVHTSGSSGVIGLYVYGPMDWMLGSVESVYPRFKWLLSEPAAAHTTRAALPWRIAYVGATRGHFGGNTFVLAAAQPSRFSRPFVDIRFFDVNDPWDMTIRGLNAFQPHSLVGYSMAHVQLARARERGELQISPRELTSGAEPLFAPDRALVERAFGIRVANAYASSEHLVMGFAPPGHDAMVLCENRLIFEPRPDCTFVTNLFNRTLPLIRYRMDDVLDLLPEGHPPHPHYPHYRQIKGVRGRTETIPYFRNDQGELDFIHPITLVELYAEGLQAFQIQLVNERSFICRAQIADGQRALQALEAALRQVLESKRMARSVTFTIERAAHIDTDPKTRKFRLILPAAQHRDELTESLQ